MQIPKLHVIEFAGLPNTFKTSLVHSVASRLEKERFRNKIVSEYRGDSHFYSQAKLTPLISLARSYASVVQIVESYGAGRELVLLFDRGLWDSIVWTGWFHSRDSSSQNYEKVCTENYAQAKKLASTYHVVVTNDSFENSVNRNNGFGSIVNYQNMEQLRREYSRKIEIFSNYCNFIELDTNHQNYEYIERSLLSIIIDIISK